jgi:hypothetical protein
MSSDCCAEQQIVLLCAQQIVQRGNAIHVYLPFLSEARYLYTSTLQPKLINIWLLLVYAFSWEHRALLPQSSGMYCVFCCSQLMV